MFTLLPSKRHFILKEASGGGAWLISEDSLPTTQLTCKSAQFETSRSTSKPPGVPYRLLEVDLALTHPKNQNIDVKSAT